jgi:hypothetical protein
VDYFVPIPSGILKTTLSPAYKVNLRAIKVDSKDINGKSGIYFISIFHLIFLILIYLFLILPVSSTKDPFFVIRHNNTPLYRSEFVKQTLDPVWIPFEINITDLSGLDSLFDIEVYDWYFFILYSSLFHFITSFFIIF